MKKLLYTAIVATFAIGVVSCNTLDKVLDAPSQSSYSDDVVFSNYALAEYNVFGIGEVFGHTNSYRGRVHLLYGFNTDIELRNTSSLGDANATTSDDRYRMAEYNSTPDDKQNNTSTNAYNEIVTGIERANLCIQGLRKYGNVENNPDMAQLLGESLSYRAFFYFELIKMWGEVPLRTEPVSAETIYLKKSDRDDIYLQILADLDEAINLLYWPNASTITTRSDRMNKAFAMGLYARTALSAAGYSWRPDDGLVGTGNAGSLRLTTNPELSADKLYPKALSYLKTLISTGCCSLEPSYEQLWRKFNNSEHLSGVPEVIFVAPFSDSRGRWNYTHAFPNTAGGPWITNNSSRGGDTGPAPTLWWKYDSKDVRRDITCVPMQWNGTNQNFEIRGAVNYWYWGKYRFDWMLKHPYNGGNDDGVKPIIMRYSDVLLMAAELAAYENDLEYAKTCLAQVRDRACKSGYTKYTAVSGLSAGSASDKTGGMIADHNKPETILGAIFTERALELAGEMVRKQDLIRWGLLKTALDETAKDIEDLAKMQGAYEAYLPYSSPKEITDEKTKEVLRTVDNYKVFWRPAAEGIELFGLEPSQIGQQPADYSEIEPNGWKKQDFLNAEAFYNATTDMYRWEILYRNEFNDPYPRSVWPMYALTMSAMQGALVNDYGYPSE